MNKKWLGVVSMAVFFVLAVGGFYYLGAQMGGGSRGGQGQSQQRGAGMNRPPMGMMGGGAAMIAYDNYIYVLSGQSLFKIDPLKMKIEKELMLGRSKMAPGGAQNGQGTAPVDEE